MSSTSRPLRRRAAGSAALAACALLSGCITPQSFLDPAMPKLSYGDLAKPEAPIPLAAAVFVLTERIRPPSLAPEEA